MNKKSIPSVIKKVGFDFNWEEEKVWNLVLPVEEMGIDELSWHFEIPFWSTKKGFYDLKPVEVLDNPENYPDEFERILNADLSYPLDIMSWRSRWLLLDGLHRLTKAQYLGDKKVKVRKVPIEMIERIKK